MAIAGAVLSIISFIIADVMTAAISAGVQVVDAELCADTPRWSRSSRCCRKMFWTVSAGSPACWHLRLGATDVSRALRLLRDLAKTAKKTKSEALELLAVAARCFELQFGLDVLRLDRMRDASPANLEVQRLLLKDERRENILGGRPRLSGQRRTPPEGE